MPGSTQYHLRIVNGKWSVFITRVDGEPVPEYRQAAVFANLSQSRAQQICDALNTGLGVRIEAAVAGERAARAAARQRPQGPRR